MQFEAKEPAHSGFSFFCYTLEYFVLFFSFDMAYPEKCRIDIIDPS